MSGEEDHAAAFLALLSVGKPVEMGLHDGAVPPRSTLPYMLVYFVYEMPPDAPGNSLDGMAREMTMRAIVHCVGGNQASSRAVAAHAKGAVLNKRLEVNGWLPGIIRQDSARDPVRDETTGTVVMDAVQVYRSTAQPAI